MIYFITLLIVTAAGAGLFIVRMLPVLYKIQQDKHNADTVMWAVSVCTLRAQVKTLEGKQ